MNRRVFLKLAGVCLLPAACSAKSAAGEKRPPNIILMMADDLGIGDVKCYGFNDKIKTPRLDAMAAAGMRFDRFYSQSPVCSPTRGSCLTGRHAFRYGIFEANVGHLRDQEITLPEVLKEKGYTSGHFGKWHLGQMVSDMRHNKAERMGFSCPSGSGFDEWFSVHSSVKTYDPFGPNGEDVAESPNPFYHNGKLVTENVSGDTSRIMMDRAIPFIRKAARDEKPFMACIWFNTPHAPIDAGPEYVEMYKHLPEKYRKYYGAITAMDEQVGRLRRELRSMGIEDNTMLWFTSDNGPVSVGSTGPYLGSKRHLFEGGIRVPGILEWPDKVKPNQTTDMIACTSDYFLTSVEAAGFKVENPNPIDGTSLMPLVEAKQSRRKGELCFQSHGSLVVMNQNHKAIRVNTGAFSQNLAERSNFPLDQWLLFDMENDRQESTNIAEKKPEIVKQMVAVYEKWSASCRDSFNGKDYNEKDFIPDGQYRENGGLRASKKKRIKDKSKKKEKKAGRK